MRIMGIDPSLSSTGYAIISGVGKDTKIIRSGSIKTTPKDGETETRINTIADEVTKKIIDCCTDYIVIERPAFGMGNGVKSTQDLAGLYYVLLCRFIRMGFLVVPVMPSQWKSIVGVKGKDRKEQKQSAINLVKQVYNRDVETNDESDSICIALYGSLLEIETERRHRKRKKN